jgi:hypothetical protein
MPGVQHYQYWPSATAVTVFSQLVLHWVLFFAGLQVRHGAFSGVQHHQYTPSTTAVSLLHHSCYMLHWVLFLQDCKPGMKEVQASSTTVPAQHNSSVTSSSQLLYVTLAVIPAGLQARHDGVSGGEPLQALHLQQRGLQEPGCVP